MKIFILFLILGLCQGLNNRSPVNIRERWCGILPDCYQVGASPDDLEYYSFERQKRGLPDFTSIARGECPRDKPPCPIIL